MPVRFLREMLCLRLSNGRLRGKSCPSPARFDVLSHHRYSTGVPCRRALNSDGASIPDIGKLTKLLRTAERTGRALPRKRHRMWGTEVSYDSSPPDPDGVRTASARPLPRGGLLPALAPGVDTITWFQIRDQTAAPTYAASNQSGIYFNDGRSKPAQRTFRFPFVAERAGAGSLRVWGRAPVAGAVRIEQQTSSGWRLVRTVRATRHGTFLVRIGGRRAALRARVGGETSLSWRVK